MPASRTSTHVVSAGARMTIRPSDASWATGTTGTTVIGLAEPCSCGRTRVAVAQVGGRDVAVGCRADLRPIATALYDLAGRVAVDGHAVSLEGAVAGDEIGAAGRVAGPDALTARDGDEVV